MIWLLLILLVLVIYLIFFVTQFINVIFKGYAPFISTDRETIKMIMNEVWIKDQSTIYELGCGWARFLRLIEKIFPQAKLIGVENLSSIYLAAKLKLIWLGSKIKLLKQDFFTISLKDADLIYCYLNNTTMAKLGEKFRQECKTGALIVSRSFPIPQFTPEKIITVNNKKIFFYKI